MTTRVPYLSIWFYFCRHLSKLGDTEMLLFSTLGYALATMIHFLLDAYVANNWVPTGLSMADVATEVTTFVGSAFVGALLVALIALALIPRIVRTIKGTARGR